jgi:hypothetical protein
MRQIEQNRSTDEKGFWPRKISMGEFGASFGMLPADRRSDHGPQDRAQA